MMTSKERMLIALNLGKPDRIPATIHQWQPFHLKYFMDGKSDIEAFKEVGLDAAISVFEQIEKKSDNWRVKAKEYIDGDNRINEYIIYTPGGTLTYKTGSTEITTYVTDPLIKNDEDIFLIKKYRPIPFYDKKSIDKKYDEVGDNGILRGFVTGNQGGCWQDACMLHGTEEMILATFDKPEWVHEFLGILLDQKLVFIEESLKGTKFDLIETGGGASSNNVISPKIHEEYCLPYDKKMHDALRSIGHKTVYHTCGGMTKILDLILKNGCDASETLSPVGVGGDIINPSEIVEKFNGKLAMIGGLDQFNILTDGTEKQIRKEVFKLFDSYGKNGGYIISASDHFFHTPKKNLITLAHAAKECVY